jgi:hypothetical protein
MPTEKNNSLILVWAQYICKTHNLSLREKLKQLYTFIISMNHQETYLNKTSCRPYINQLDDVQCYIGEKDREKKHYHFKQSKNM